MTRCTHVSTAIQTGWVASRSSGVQGSLLPLSSAPWRPLGRRVSEMAIPLSAEKTLWRACVTLRPLWSKNAGCGMLPCLTRTSLDRSARSCLLGRKIKQEARVVTRHLRQVEHRIDHICAFRPPSLPRPSSSKWPTLRSLPSPASADQRPLAPPTRSRPIRSSTIRGPAPARPLRRPLPHALPLQEQSAKLHGNVATRILRGEDCN